MKVWQFLLSKLKQQQPCILLYVLDNKGSSPGRKGFKMALAADGAFSGTIGGGIMEVKLLELAKDLLAKKQEQIIIKKQFHDKKHARNQSGLICSGEQTLALIPLHTTAIPLIKEIVNHTANQWKLCIQKEGIHIIKEAITEEFDYQNENAPFKIIIALNHKKKVHIFGAGHVGLALSQVLSLLDFQIFIYDDRPKLNTLVANQYAHHVQLIDYQRIKKSIQFSEEDFVVIMTFSYRTDKIILKQLYPLALAYIGMMGSDHKIATLLKELETEGIPPTALKHISAPIGMPIYSKTAMEIAISIAGQLIFEKNKLLPSGRQSIK
jgi:xanthine dehydrogenase accessory factor